MPGCFRLYLDEVGNHKYLDYSKPCNNAINERYFALMGVFIELGETYDEIHGDLEGLKKAHFKYDIDQPFPLHRVEVLKKTGPFGVLANEAKERAFYGDLIRFLSDHEMTLIAIVLDKLFYKRQYRYPCHPYHFSLELMLERYCGYLDHLNLRGDVLAEARGRQEDQKLMEEYRELYDCGTAFMGDEITRRTLTSKEIKVHPKQNNIAGLQIADMLAAPCLTGILKELDIIPEIKQESHRIIYAGIRDKFNKHLYSGEVKGYGKVFKG